MMLRVCDKCGDQNSRRVQCGIKLDLCHRCEELLTREGDLLRSVAFGNMEPLSRWLLNVPLPEYDDLENAVQRMWKDWENEKPLYTHCGHTYGCTCPACTGNLVEVGKI